MFDVPGLKAVYSRLQDDLSRKIFENRLLYSISGDQKFIAEIAIKEPIYRKFPLEETPSEKIIERVKACEKPVILYGAGVFGKSLIHAVESSRVKCFWDRKEIGEIHGIPVQYPGTNYDGELVIVSVSALYVNDIIHALRTLGVPDEKMIVPDLSQSEDLENQYFDKDIIQFCDQEVFVDAGSYNFGTSKLLLQKCNTVKSIYAFEPDENHWGNVSDGIHDSKFNHVSFIKKGLWNKETRLSFESALSESHISDCGTSTVAVTSIDQSISEPVTFIKMDIEGAELEALKGSAEHLVSDKPKLAICVYHKPEDILSIPQYILSLVPEYRLYLRHYSFSDNETVLYAVI